MTYVMQVLRSLILTDLDLSVVLPGFAVVAGLGVAMVALDVRLIRRYDWFAEQRVLSRRLPARATARTAAGRW